MGSHIVNGKFQSDKYPECPSGKVPLSTKDPMAQDLLWEYAQRRRHVDAEFSEDLEECLISDGFISTGRDISDAESFEDVLNRVLGKNMRESSYFCRKVWSALANVVWYHKDGNEASYSFRAAGGLIAEIIGRGDYLDWYCCGPYAEVDDEIQDAMAKEGWSFRFYD